VRLFILISTWAGSTSINSGTCCTLHSSGVSPCIQVTPPPAPAPAGAPTPNTWCSLQHFSKHTWPPHLGRPWHTQATTFLSSFCRNPSLAKSKQSNLLRSPSLPTRNPSMVMFVSMTVIGRGDPSSHSCWNSIYLTL